MSSASCASCRTLLCDEFELAVCKILALGFGFYPGTVRGGAVVSRFTNNPNYSLSARRRRRRPRRRRPRVHRLDASPPHGAEQPRRSSRGRRGRFRLRRFRPFPRLLPPRLENGRGRGLGRLRRAGRELPQERDPLRAPLQNLQPLVLEALQREAARQGPAELGDAAEVNLAHPLRRAGAIMSMFRRRSSSWVCFHTVTACCAMAVARRAASFAAR